MVDERRLAEELVPPPRATFLELFLDLAYVFALTRVSQRLIAGLETPDGDVLSSAVEALLLFLALWMVWSLTAWSTSRLNSDRALGQAIVVWTMFGSMVMAVALPRAFHERDVLFATAYVSVQVGRALLLVLFLRDGLPRATVRLLCWGVASAVPWLVGAIGPHRWQLPLWVLALLMDYGGAATGWPVPGLGRRRAAGITIAGEHLGERYQQFFLIALGESILVMGVAASGTDLVRGSASAFVLAFVTTALLWRIYFHRAGHLLGEALALARRPGRLGESATYTHLTMVVAVVLTAVGYELVIKHPTGRDDPVWAVVVLGGPALFLAARARFEYEIFGRVSRPRVIAAAVLVALIPLMRSLPAIAVLATSAVVLGSVAAADALRGHGRPAERPASPM
ncbi:low temperature requirement protein A [Micromonospora sp. MS34]|uniref:low temperature requirement protein A n=1 Tax=Micromonospora sp. MS34 TaxID=3385971 RepID=UPI0039A0BB9F